MVKKWLSIEYILTTFVDEHSNNPHSKLRFCHPFRLCSGDLWINKKLAFFPLCSCWFFKSLKILALRVTLQKGPVSKFKRLIMQKKATWIQSSLPISLKPFSVTNNSFGSQMAVADQVDAAVSANVARSGRSRTDAVILTETLKGT